MPEDRSQYGPPIGLIARKGSLATRIRKIVRGGGLSIAFEASPEELQADHAIGEAEVVIVIGPIESRDGSLFGRVRARLPDARIVVCSEPVESPTIRWAIDMGVDGLIWSTRLEESLELTVRAVHAGQLVVPRDVLRRMQAPNLTNREKQTLSMVIMGLTNSEIAQKLFISESTVKSHLNTAYEKLGVHSRAEAQRLITDPDQGLGTGILAITAPGLTRGRPPRKGGAEG
jgi:DNA-binding NarL/FixJ family response regulator